MNNINLSSLVQAYSSLDKDSFEKFKRYNGIRMSNNEIDDLKKLLEKVKKDIFSVDIKLFDNFYIGYEIPQISKEFDLLKIGGDNVVNMELKSISVEEKILKQLKKNKYYLKSLGRKMYRPTAKLSFFL